MTDPAPLPEFENPPVSEVALSVAFSPLEKWRSLYAGMYWSSIRTEYPNTDSQLPLPSVVERFEEQIVQAPQIQVEFGNPDLNRFWFLSEPPNRLIQIQRDRFIVNWRKVSGDDVYPRYDAGIRPLFEREWRKFKEFVSNQNIGTIEIQQCEITYLNDIPKGEAWQSFNDALGLFAPFWGKGSDNYLPSPESLSVFGSFRMPEARGRLHFAVQHVRRATDQAEVVQLQLVARGRPNTGSDADVLNWMDFGREWIVRAFSDLASQKAHLLWRRTR